MTGARDALVAGRPGLTRDRQYGKADLEGLSLTLIDTGGMLGGRKAFNGKNVHESLSRILSDEPEPLVRTLRPGVFANYFPAEHERVWTMNNATAEIVSGVVLAVPVTLKLTPLMPAGLLLLQHVLAADRHARSQRQNPPAGTLFPDHAGSESRLRACGLGRRLVV